MGESFEECSAREVLEETGLRVEDLRFMTAVNTVMDHKGEQRHYVTLFMVGVVKDNEAEPRVSHLSLESRLISNGTSRYWSLISVFLGSGPAGDSSFDGERLR